MGYNPDYKPLPPWNVSNKDARLCPVCLGKGKLKNTNQYTASEDIRCHGCNGKGWVVV